jgi:hypothetical protein
MRGLMVALVVSVSLSALTTEAGAAAPSQPVPPTQPLTTATPPAPPRFGGFISANEDPSVSVSYTNLVAAGGAPGGREAIAVRPRTCELWVAPGGPGSMGTENLPLAPVEGDLVDGAWYYQTCR